MIKNRLIWFKSRDKFNQWKDAGDIKDTSIVFVNDTSIISTHDIDNYFVGWDYLGFTNYYTSTGELFNSSDGLFYVKE